MKRILVTGGGGFIASHMVDRLANHSDNKIVILDNLLTGKKQYISNKENVVFIQGDANSQTDLAQLFEKYQFDYVFHYAAVVGVKRTLEDPILVLHDIDGFEYLLELCRRNNIKRIFFSSSSEVYGESVSFPQHEETTPLNSRLPYAIVKSVGEAYLRAYHQVHGIDYTVFRFFNTYGPRQSSDFVMSNFINAALENKDLTIYGSGEQTRTFCYIDDNIDACFNAFKNNMLVNDVANIGSNIEIPIVELAKKIVRISQSKSKIVHLPALKDGDMPRRMPDITKMEALLARDFIPLHIGIAKTLEFFRRTYS